MDIAYYLSELLEQLGEVNVPGLGSFTRIKVDGYYNNDEGRFYPPASRLEFSQQYIDDDVLTQYIGVKKRISLASSKYFTEKYITGLKQEVMSREIPFAELGSLYFENGRIQFRAAQSLPDPEFYGYPAIDLNKKGNEPVHEYQEPEIVADEEPVTPETAVEGELPAPVLTYEPFTAHDHLHDGPVDAQGAEQEYVYEPAASDETETPVVDAYIPTSYESEYKEPAIGENDYSTPPPVATIPQTEEEDDFIFHSAAYREPAAEEENSYEETEDEPRRGYKWLWITLIVLVVAGGAVYGWFYYQQQQVQPVKKVKAAPAAAPKDTTDSTHTAKDTAAAANRAKVAPVQNTAAQTIDSTKRRYEVIGVAEPSLKAANKDVNNYHNNGINAHILSHKDAPGPLYKVSLGTYSTLKQAMAGRDSLLKTKKVRKDINIRPINPRK